MIFVDNTIRVVYIINNNTKRAEVIVVDKEKIGKTLTILRGEETREEIAKKIGVSVSAWQMYENGQRIPKDEIKVKIASYFKKSVGEIFYP